MMQIVDFHCHLDFFADPRSVAATLETQGVTCLSMTIDPRSYRHSCELFSAYSNIFVALGLHPWSIADGSCGNDDLERFEELALTTPHIGEIGLDFGPRGRGSEQAQIAAFERVITAATHAGTVISLHSLKADEILLDCLERHHTTEKAACILHRFSGTSEQLERAVADGCWFSIGPQMLATRRGREYAKAIPTDRILLETDAPSHRGQPMDAEGLCTLLRDSLARLEDIHGRGLGERILETSRNLLRVPS